MRARAGACLSILLALSTPPLRPPSAEADEPTLGVQVNRAIERGVAWLRRWQRPDGGFRGPHADEYPLGQTAFALYALTKSQVPAEDPAVAKALAYVLSRKVEKTYEAATKILALDALKDPSHDLAIQGAAFWLEQNVNAKEGIWAYPFGPSADHRRTDLSNTQFACLGLWVAEAHGYRASKDLWERLARVVPDYQAPSGAFTYRRGGEANGSMTTAGVTVLTLALERVSGNDRDKPYVLRATRALAKGWEYLEERFRVDANPEGEYAALEGPLYFLYGLERIAALADRRKIGGHDWYAEGARHLLAIQGADGGWGDPTENTCYALLFLRQATATRMGREGGALEGPGVAPPPASQGPKPPGRSVPFVTRWLMLGPFANADDSGLSRDDLSEANLSPYAGERQENLGWTVVRSPYAYFSPMHALGAKPRSLSYGFTYLHATKEADVVLWIGHHDGARVYLDGVRVHDRHFHAGYDADRWSVPARLAAGPHRLLFKIEEWNAGNGGWLRFAHADGSEAPEVVPSLSSGAPEPEDVVRSKPNAYSLADLLRLLPADRSMNLDFTKPEDLDRVVVQHPQNGYPTWAGRTEAKPWWPHPGAFGVLGIHPESQSVPASVIRKVRLPPAFPFLRLRVSSDPYVDPKGTVDFVLKTSVFDGEVHALSSQVIEAGPPSPDGWKTVDVDLRAYAGKEVLLVVEVAAGGKTAWRFEQAFFDEMSVGTSLR